MIISQRNVADTIRGYFIYDGLGSVVGLTNESGTLVRSKRYDPYGNATEDIGYPLDLPTNRTPWGFAGEYRDEATGLYKIGARYYDPAIGRWSQTDPVNAVVDPRQVNAYGYAAGNPVNVTDPSGELAPLAAVAVARFALYGYAVYKGRSGPLGGEVIGVGRW